MKYRLNIIAGAAAILSAIAPALAGDAPSFKITGDVHTQETWDAARIDRDLKSDIQVVKYTLKGHDHTSRAAPLIALIEKSQPDVNPRIKNHELQFVVAVQGFDGYTVDFSMAELLPAIGNRKVWIALDEDGKPLSQEGGALEVIVPEDVKPGRWVHGITTITVTDGAKISPPSH